MQLYNKRINTRWAQKHVGSLASPVIIAYVFLPVMRMLYALMNNREALSNKLKQAALLVREGGDVHSDNFTSAESFAVEIERLVVLVSKSNNSPMAYIRALIAKKHAKYSWCAPSFDLDDYLAGTRKR